MHAQAFWTLSVTRLGVPVFHVLLLPKAHEKAENPLWGVAVQGHKGCDGSSCLLLHAGSVRQPRVRVQIQQAAARCLETCWSAAQDMVCESSLWGVAVEGHKGCDGCSCLLLHAGPFRQPRVRIQVQQAAARLWHPVRQGVRLGAVAGHWRACTCTALDVYWS